MRASNVRLVNLEPSFSNAFNIGWAVFKKNALWLIALVLLLGLADAPLDLGRQDNNIPWVADIYLGMFALAYFVLLHPIFHYGGKYLFVQAVRGEKLDFKMLIEGFRTKYLDIVIAHLAATIIIGLGFVALIIPGIFLACRLWLVPYIIMDSDMKPMEAIEESWQLTKGHAWNVFSMGFASFWIGIVGLVMLFVGVFPAIAWIGTSFATYYDLLIRQQEVRRMDEGVDDFTASVDYN